MSTMHSEYGRHARRTPLDLANATPRRVPKLAVRQKPSPADSTPSTPDAIESSEESVSESYFTRQSDHHAMPSAATRPSVPDMKDGKLPTRQNSKSANASSQKQVGRRRSSGVLGFFTLKEPSTSALEEFAEQERKKLAAQKGTKLLSSSQRLPEHVPKVNSKWDGLPDSVKRKHAERERVKKEGGNRNSSISLVSRSSNASQRRPEYSRQSSFGSLSSRPQACQSQDRRRNLSVAILEREDDQVDDRNWTFLSPPSPPPAVSRGVYLNSLEDLDSQEALALPDHESSSSGPEDSAPRTPVLSSVSSPRMPHGIRGLSPPDDFVGTLWLSDTDDVIVKTAVPNVLPPPTILDRRKPRHGHVRNFSYGGRGHSTTDATSRNKRKDEVLPWEVSEPPAPNQLAGPILSSKSMNMDSRKMRFSKLGIK